MQKNRVTVSCSHCALAFDVKASRATSTKFCSVECKADALRTKPRNDPRPCECCGSVFQPSRKRGDAKYCSKSCIWQATRGPEFNRRIARESREKNGDTQRGRGEGRTYRKYLGRHEHRVIAEKKIGRPLLPGEVVHHIDGDHLNNDPSNLAVMSQRDHMRDHGLGIPGKPLAHEPWKFRGTR